jgi:predicted nucleotidyltransferase
LQIIVEVTSLLPVDERDRLGCGIEHVLERRMRWSRSDILVLSLSNDAITEVAAERAGSMGSVLRDDFGPASDIDVLVEFEPGHVPGFAFVDLEDELASMLCRCECELPPRSSQSAAAKCAIWSACAFANAGRAVARAT